MRRYAHRAALYTATGAARTAHRDSSANRDPGRSATYPAKSAAADQAGQAMHRSVLGMTGQHRIDHVLPRSNGGQLVITRQRACTAASATVVVASLVGLTGCGTSSESSSGTSSSTTTSAVTADDLQLRVKSMRVAIYEGRYRDAYDMRSDACRLAIGYDEYARAIATEYTDKPHPAPDNLRVLVVTAADPSHGVHRAQAQIYEAGHEQDPANETPRWWTVEEGQWKFDNCTPPAP